jgi:Protein of unknown function (DUF2726)
LGFSNAQEKELMPSIRSRQRRPNQFRYQRPRLYWARHFLLTKNEAAFFRVLKDLVADCYVISCKVRLADIVTCADADWSHGQANRISQKHVDFVINFTDSSRIVAAIELDDSSHELPERRARDVFLDQLFHQTGLKLIRIPAQWHYAACAVGRRLVKAGLLVMRQPDRINRGIRPDWHRRKEKSHRWSFGGAQAPKADTMGRRRF